MPKFYVVCFLLISFYTRAHAQALQVNHWTTNGEVRKIMKSGTTSYVGGSFSHVGFPVGNVVELDGTTGQAIILNMAAPNDVVRTAISADNIYVAGYNTTIGGLARVNLAAIAVSTGLATLVSEKRLVVRQGYGCQHFPGNDRLKSHEGV